MSRADVGLAAILVIYFVPVGNSLGQDFQISFNGDVRPILSEHCFRCHGPDASARNGGLRLDEKTSATRPAKSGASAVVPGKPEESELLVRVLESDVDIRMPPSGTTKPLDAREIAVLRAWISQGATWEAHWSTLPPRRPPFPTAPGAVSIVDRFVLRKLIDRDVRPSPEADRVVLLRRLTYDLTGLPPTEAETAAYLRDERPDAYDRLVERRLASPHYGERLAQWWLDLVRFADTVGYHSDVDRAIWPYRDYVIAAFNADKPFDRFTIEQLAGDLLPNAGPAELVASAYNMLGMTTEEGGAQPKEYLAKYSAERVRNFGSVWMGATLGCAECHDHKYDPYSSRDFYSLAAFFADLKQDGVGTPKPTLFLATEVQQRRRNELQATLARLKKEKRPTKEIAAAQKSLDAYEKTLPATIVSVSGPPRPIRVLSRGDWMDESGAIVEPAVPKAMSPIPTEGRLTRLDLARWLVAPDHPQTARVVVNRLWKQFFGAGLSDSLEDLGSQGEWPTHPELLDWLAVEFRESGWSLKHVVRLLVKTDAYRRSSFVREDLATVDPLNRLYARQTAVRRDAETIRDGALAAAGLLERSIGGPSVKPYQPAGHWRFLNFPTREYAPSEGPLQYRRGLYTHWQRTLLHPALVAFDAPSREACTAKRAVSNTPQASLALLNDPSQVEAARVLAASTLRSARSDAERLPLLWRRVLSREPSREEAELLTSLLAKHRFEFAADPKSAEALIRVGRSPVADLEPAELAAWTSVARAVLNLDETITRE